uniref:Uncharacterized protein n=1 Tax=Myoviridae sp. ctLnO19 TaxID=2825085 RepID=A0A8S5P1R0_9CAUD|nr:MAG TPA: hypothetical protein [Myoviridae sp. ctLnO19]
MLDTKQHIDKLLHRIRTKFMKYLPTKYKEIGSFDFINLTEEKDDVDLLAYTVKFRPTDAYGNEDKVAWTSEVLTIPKYEGHEDDWKKWCLYHTDPRLDRKLEDLARIASNHFKKAAQSPENRETFFADKLARRRALRYVKDNLRYFQPMNFEIEIQTRAYNEEHQEFPCWDFVVLRRKQKELLAVSRTNKGAGVKPSDSSLTKVIGDLTEQLLRRDVRLVAERFDRKFYKLWKYLSHNVSYSPCEIFINACWDNYNMANETLKVELRLVNPFEEDDLFNCCTHVPVRHARHEIVTGKRSDAFRSSVRHLAIQLFEFCKSKGWVADKVKKADITDGKKGVSLPFHVHEKDLSSHACSGSKAITASALFGQDEAKKTFSGYMPSIIPVMEALLGNDKSYFDKETKVEKSKLEELSSNKPRFQNIRYLNVAKKELIDTKHLKYRAGLLDAIKEEYSFAVANHIEGYLAIRDLHAKADLSNKVIITNTDVNSVEVDHNTVVEVKVMIQVKDRITGNKVLILKFVAPYAEIQESPLGASTNSYCKVYSNRQKYYVQLEEVLNELNNELKAGIV